MADATDGTERKSARSKRKAKEKANARKRAAAGNVVNPYAVIEKGEEEEKEEDGAGEAELVEDSSGTDGHGAKAQETKRVEDTSAIDGAGVTPEETRPKTSYSDTSSETLVGVRDPNTATSTPPPQPPLAEPPAPEEPVPKFTLNEWKYDDIPDVSIPDYITGERDPDEPLTEAEIRHKEIDDWFAAKTTHPYGMKKSSMAKAVDFVYAMKYEQGEGRAEWIKDLRLLVWRAAVRANFWWTNPDTSEPTGRPAPIIAPAGVYEQNFAVFVHCAAERLDRVGRDLPDPEYVRQIENSLRLFFRRIEHRKLYRPLAHFAFLLLIDEEQKRAVVKEGLQMRLKMAFDGVKTMDWAGLGILRMGELPKRKGEAPGRTELVWRDVVQRFRV